jgi:Holliday junction resolvase
MTKMVHKYNKGYRFELIVKEEYEKQGWKCIRSAGSHQFADLVCMKGSETLCIQCKNSKTPVRPSKDDVKLILEWVRATGYPLLFINKLPNTRATIMFSP